MTSKRKAVIFDGDDTLWATQPLYNQAKKSFFSLLADHLGLEEDQVAPRFEQIDMANFKTLGFSRQRFPSSFMLCYAKLAKERGCQVDELVLQEVRAIGESVFSGSIEAFPDAFPVLSALAPMYRLFLLTKGDRIVQEQRLEQAGLARHFERVWIRPRKSEIEFLLVTRSSGLSESSCWSVGNSLRSDINPALRIGMKAIWVPVETWAYERADDQLAPSEVHIVSQLKDILEILL